MCCSSNDLGSGNSDPLKLFTPVPILKGMMDYIKPFSSKLLSPILSRFVITFIKKTMSHKHWKTIE